MSDGIAPSVAAGSAIGLLRDLGAGSIDHPGGDLLSHLERTAALLGSWGVSEELVLAGLCHAAYGTDGFRVALLGFDERARLRAIIGGAAESIVHRYDLCDRTATYAGLGEQPLTMHDRVTGVSTELSPDEAAEFATLTIANELDLVLHGAFDADGVAEIAALTRRLAPYAPSAAERALAAIDDHG